MFVSHASSDAGTAHRIVQDLEETGLTCWIAPRDIRPGIDYGEGILDGIKRSQNLLLLISAASIRSPHVAREVERAVNAGTNIIPARIEDVELSGSLEYFVGLVHGIDARPGPDGSVNSASILDALRRQTASEPTQTTTPTKTATPAPTEEPQSLTLRTGAGIPATDDSFGFVGRRDELDYFDQAIQSALNGSRQVIAIGGEPGVGKTRLSTEVIGLAQEAGMIAGVGVCDIDVPEPYQPIADAIARSLSQLPESLTSKVTLQYPWVSALINRRPVDASGSQPVDRQRLFADFAGAIETVATSGPLCFLFDDVQWATDDTIALIRHLARVLASSPVILLMTYRDSEVTQEHPLFGLLADLHRMSGTKQIVLTGLEFSDVMAMAEAAAGHQLDDSFLELSRRLYESTSGSPFFTTQIIQHLVETGRIVNVDGRWTISDLDPLDDLPASVRDVVVRRVSNLDEATQALLRTAAVIGLAFDLELLAKVTSQDVLDVLDRLESAIQAGLLEEVGLDRFRFRHQLTRVSLLEQLSATRRAHLHRKIGEILEESGIEGVAEELAFHWSQAGAASDVDRVARYCRLAADQALARQAPEDARRLYKQALQALESASNPDPAERCDLLIALGQVERGLGNGSARATLIEAADIARNIGDENRLARAVTSMLRGGFIFSAVGVGDAELVTLIDEILPSTSGVARARLLVARAAETSSETDPKLLEPIVDEALDIARSNNDVRTLVELMCSSSVALGGPDYTNRRLELGNEALQLSRQLSSIDLQAIAMLISMCARYELADVTVLSEIPALESLANQMSDRTIAWFIKMFIATRTIVSDIDSAEAAAMEAFQVAEASHQPEAFTALSVHIGEIFWHTGRLAEIVDEFKNELDARPIPGLRSGYARVLLELGRFDDAREQLDFLRESQFESVRDMNWMGYMSDVGVVVAALGTDDERRLIYEWLEPFAGRFMLSFWFVTNCGSVDRILGLLAEGLGDLERAEQHMTTALRLEESFEHTVFADRCREALKRIRDNMSGQKS